MKSSDSHSAVHAHCKRKNLVLSLVFCVAALCVVLLVLVGPGRMLAGAAARSGVETALPASVAAVSDAQPTAAPEQTPAQPETVNINDFGGYPAAGDALGEITISGTSVDCTIYYGDEDPQLDTGAGIYTGGKIPGEGGTILVAGHTATYFRDFEHAQNGAMITVTTATAPTPTKSRICAWPTPTIPPPMTWMRRRKILSCTPATRWDRCP